uniref:Uncharacterized protein n=1 Tax=viral metagenome TaxID=1070528 RepID=A0A6C0CBR7_9ZZZZ
MIKSKNTSGYFTATGEYHKINGRQKYLREKPIKIKSG